MLQKIRQQMQIIIPYDDPLVIPVGFKLGRPSWGEVEELKEELMTA